MNITVYAKKRISREGKPFYNFLATLTRKDGTPQTVTVRFRDEGGIPRPEHCPMNIVVDRADANLTAKDYTRKDGTPGKSYTLWISKWEQGEAYVDHSLDDFD